MTTLREAGEARARAEGFREATSLSTTLEAAGISASAIAAALAAQADALDAGAEVAEREAQAIVDAKAEARKTPPVAKKKAEKAEALMLPEA